MAAPAQVIAEGERRRAWRVSKSSGLAKGASAASPSERPGTAPGSYG